MSSVAIIGLVIIALLYIGSIRMNSSHTERRQQMPTPVTNYTAEKIAKEINDTLKDIRGSLEKIVDLLLLHAEIQNPGMAKTYELQRKTLVRYPLNKGGYE